MIPSAPFLWGLASQAASSATNFGLSLLAGILLGPRGLGVVFIGFAAYLIAFAFQRALILDPLVSTSSSSMPPRRLQESRSGLSASLFFACGAGLGFVAIGLAIGGDGGHGLLLFAPWVAPALIQDYWRIVLFRDERGRAGAVNDLSWAIAMGFGVPIAITHPSEWTVVSCWGFGATVAMLIGFGQTRLLPGRLIEAIGWWRAQGWPLGRWLAAETLVFTLGAQGLVFVVVPIVGIAAIGGLRAVQTIFAPLSLLGPALSLPAFPHLARAVRESDTKAQAFSARLGATATALTGAYVLVSVVAGGFVLETIFGDRFARFSSLIWPIGIGQIVVATTLGVSLLLKAEGNGRGLLVSRAVVSVATIVFALRFAIATGIEGAAWGMTLGAALGAASLFVIAKRRHRPRADWNSRPGPSQPVESSEIQQIIP